MGRLSVVRSLSCFKSQTDNGLVSRDSHPSGSPSASSQAQQFPSGSYTFTTALANVTTNCTSNPDTFSCYPYSVYSPADPSRSSAAFTWVIAPAAFCSDADPRYVVSAPASPFAPSFSNVSMVLVDGGQATERLTFNFPMDIAVVPSKPLVAGRDTAATCYFNGTVMSATVWTRMRASYPATITDVPAPVNASTAFAPWPFAVEVAQVQQAGAGVPDCLDSRGVSVGNFSVTGGSAAECGCWYSNTALPA